MKRVSWLLLALLVMLGSSGAFAFETGLTSTEQTVVAIIQIGITIFTAVVVFLLGRRVAELISDGLQYQRWDAEFEDWRDG